MGEIPNGGGSPGEYYDPDAEYAAYIDSYDAGDETVFYDTQNDDAWLRMKKEHVYDIEAMQ